MPRPGCSRCGGKGGVHQEWCPFNPKRWEPALVAAEVLTPPTMGGYATAIAAGTWSYRFEKLAADIFVVAAVPTASIR